jgi:DNA ligase-1
MDSFICLIDRLAHAKANQTKQELLSNFFNQTPDPDRGYALAILSKQLRLPSVCLRALRNHLLEQVDAELFRLSYAYIGDLAETLALLWPQAPTYKSLPALSVLSERLHTLDKPQTIAYVCELMPFIDRNQRWVLLKMLTQKIANLVTPLLLQQVLARQANVAIQVVNEVWSEQAVPFLTLFAWLNGSIPKPAVKVRPSYTPPMLASAIDKSHLDQIELNEYQVEWLWQGVRVQLIVTPDAKVLLNSQGEDISGHFPELMSAINDSVVLEGELIVSSGKLSDLQQRLQAKNYHPQLVNKYPIEVRCYDILQYQGQDHKAKELSFRREKLQQWYHEQHCSQLHLSPVLPCDDLNTLQAYYKLRQKNTKGLMLKHKASLYVSGRSNNSWLQWKSEPLVVNCVLLYAQRGQGRHADYYSELTLGLWQAQQLLPIGKAYADFSETELKRIDSWIKKHTVNRFGPVRAVTPQLVFELTFAGIESSKRHVSGYKLHFPTIKQIRWDKSALDADELCSLQYYIS